MNQAFQISPQGDDSLSHGPWASLAGAKNGLRKLRSLGEVTGPATVLVEPGNYPMTETVRFEPEDGQTTYRAADENRPPVFSGGRRLEGWTEGVHQGRRAWLLDLPEAALERWLFRSLYGQGVRRPRARLPSFRQMSKGPRRPSALPS